MGMLERLAARPVQMVPTAAIERILAPDTLLVLGSEGAGKTTLAGWLAEHSPTPALRATFGQAPGPGNVHWLTIQTEAQGLERRALVTAALAKMAPIVDYPLAKVSEDPGAALEQIHRALVVRGASVVLSYDAPPSLDWVDLLVSTWGGLRRQYPRIAARIWIARPVGALFDRQVAADLTWSDGDLFELLATLLVEYLPDGLLTREVRPLLGPWVRVESHFKAAALMKWLTGQNSMAAGDVAGWWLMDSLRGKHGEITPQRFLSTVAIAAKLALQAQKVYLERPYLDKALQIVAKETWLGLISELAKEVQGEALVAHLFDQFDWPVPKAVIEGQWPPRVLAALVRDNILIPVGDRYDLRELYRIGAQAEGVSVRRFWREYR